MIQSNKLMFSFNDQLRKLTDMHTEIEHFYLILIKLYEIYQKNLQQTTIIKCST